MAVTLTLSAAKLSSIAVPSLSEAIVAYVLGYTDEAGVYHDVSVDNAPLTVSFPLTPGDTIPTAEALVAVVLADITARFGSVPDVITINGTDYPVTPP